MARDKGRTFGDAITDDCIGPFYVWMMKVLGPVMVIMLYGLIYVHIDVFFRHITGLLFKRLSAELTLLWIGIGLILLYNIVFNHVLASIIKPGGPKDQRIVESYRETLKRRAHRKSVKQDIDDPTKEDRFENVSSEVKQLLRYRHKTIDELDAWIPKRCNKCNDVKPARTHHCSVCK